LPQNDRDQRLATFDEPHRPILSRVRCIAWFGITRKTLLRLRLHAQPAATIAK
jgi:hypothetical protein